MHLEYEIPGQYFFCKNSQFVKIRLWAKSPKGRNKCLQNQLTFKLAQIMSSTNITINIILTVKTKLTIMYKNV